MLEYLTLQNFQSYADVSLADLNNYRMVLVAGPNGIGKSTLGEALCYALYGEGRAKVGDLVRNDSEGPMKVKVGLRSGKSFYEIERGTPSAASKVTTASIWKDGKKMATGSRVAEYVKAEWGKDLSLFMLTDYFGLEATDALLRGTAAVRLEVLQEIVNVGVYQKFHQEATKVVRDLRDQLLKWRERVRMLEPDGAAAAQVPKQLADLRKENDDLARKLDERRVLLSKLQARSERAGALQTEHKVLAQEVSALEEEKKEKGAAATQVLQAVKETESECQRLRSNLNALKKKLSGSPSLEECTKKIEKVDHMIGQKNVLRSLRLQATKASSEGARCPLCGGDLADHSMKKWKAEAKEMKECVLSLQHERSDLEGKRLMWADAADVARMLAVSTEQLSDLQEESKEVGAALARLNNDVSPRKARLEKVERMLQQSESQEKIAELNREVSELTSRAGYLDGVIERLQEDYNALLQKKKELGEAKKALGTVEKRLRAASIVQDAFSRYGVPMDLVGSAQAFIEPEASNVVSRFFPAYVHIINEEERGRPGISFVLETDEGRKTFRQLSEGEKAILAFGVRVAISHLLADSSGPGTGFIFLDEIASHLSAENRAVLALVAKEVLLKSHDQVFLTSHAPTRDLFDARIDVKRSRHGSTAEVVAL